MKYPPTTLTLSLFGSPTLRSRDWHGRESWTSSGHDRGRRRLIKKEGFLGPTKNGTPLLLEELVPTFSGWFSFVCSRKKKKNCEKNPSVIP